jgi:hypothetical protein
VTPDHPLSRLRPEEAEAFVSLFKMQGHPALSRIRSLVDRVLEAQDSHTDEEIVAMIEHVGLVHARGAAIARQ